MPDDEPLDDARAVGMAAAAATAKVVETAARAAADRQNRSLMQVPHDPAIKRRLDYDSLERRTGADSALKAAGVTDEPRKARITSDLLNGADPATAARAGKNTKAATKASTTRAPEQTRIR